jgi:hypothetical protein
VTGRKSNLDVAPVRRVGDTAGNSKAEFVLPVGRILGRMAQKILHERKPTKPAKRYGERRVASRMLTEDQVREYRRRYAAGETAANLAREVGMNYNAFLSMINGLTYAWVV